jgi:AraC-like DNA-binding protein
MARGEPAAALAKALGLSGPSAFSRWFRQTYGAPPSRYHRPG